jgi:hypothetical protein
MVRVAAYVPDLMDRSRLAGVGDVVGDVVFVGTPAELASVDADVVIVDLSRPGVLDVLPAVAAHVGRVVGFGSHVDTELLAAARAAGCTEVLPRSRFFADPAAVLQGPVL